MPCAPSDFAVPYSPGVPSCILPLAKLSGRPSPPGVCVAWKASLLDRDGRGKEAQPRATMRPCRSRQEGRWLWQGRAACEPSLVTNRAGSHLSMTSGLELPLNRGTDSKQSRNADPGASRLHTCSIRRPLLVSPARCPATVRCTCHQLTLSLTSPFSYGAKSTTWQLFL